MIGHDKAQWANWYLLIPYTLGGRDHSGCDCWGLVRLILEEQFNVFVPSYDVFDDNPVIHEAKMCAGFSMPINWEKVQKANVKCGDVAHIQQGDYTCHVGIFVSDTLLIHAQKSGFVIEDINNHMRDCVIKNIYRPRKTVIEP